MKLSKKGRDRLYGSHNVFYDDDIEGDVVALYELSEVWEFEPDDFQEMVCLTVEEASEVWDSLINLVSYVESIDGGMSVLVRDGQRNIDLIRNRIKQVEKCDA